MISRDATGFLVGSVLIFIGAYAGVCVSAWLKANTALHLVAIGVISAAVCIGIFLAGMYLLFALFERADQQKRRRR